MVKMRLKKAALPMPLKKAVLPMPVSPWLTAGGQEGQQPEEAESEADGASHVSQVDEQALKLDRNLSRNVLADPAQPQPRLRFARRDACAICGRFWPPMPSVRVG